MNNLKKYLPDLKIYLTTVTIVSLILMLVAAFLWQNNLQSNNSVKQVVAEINFLDVQKCFGGLTSTNQVQCLNDFVKQYKNSLTTKELLSKLEQARGESSVIETSCHPIAHAIGRQTLDIYKNVGDAFQACDYTCHSGCYHGVMERMFSKGDDTTHISVQDLQQSIPTVCDASQFKDPSTSVIFQCLHGVGHAILYTLDYDLRLSLSMCDLLPSTYDQESCYGGIFMENVTAFEKQKRDLNPNDMLYPCNSVDYKYKSQCYLMQTSVMLEFGVDYSNMSSFCLQAEEFKDKCFVSIGRDLSNLVRIQQKDLAVSVCSNITDQDLKNACVDGVIYALIDNTWNAEYAYVYCDSLQGQTQQSCFMASNSYLQAVYNFDRNKILQQCGKYAQNSQVCSTETSY